MSSNPAARNARLRTFLNAVLHGEKKIGAQGSLFLDAVCAHPDPPACISGIIASDTGLSCLQEAIRSDFSPTFLNGPVSALLRYLQAPALKTIGGGQFLVKILIAIVHPPIFWTVFIDEFRAGNLEENGQLCFAWLLLQLILLPGEAADPYRTVAEDQSIIDLLLNLAHPDAKAIGQKISKVLSTSTPLSIHTDNPRGPGGRHDNDFVDFREIAILPTAEEINSKESPFYLPSSAFDDPDTESIRTSMYLDNQFRLLREDMLYEMREEVQVLLGSKKGRTRGMVIDGLSLLDVYCGTEGKRSKWGLTLECEGALPQLKGQKGAKDRKKYLMENIQGKKILKHQSLACLLVDGQVEGFPTIHRDEELLARDKPVVVLQFGGKRSTMTALLKLKASKKIKLVQIDTAIFSYEPVLTALQQIKDLPLSQELLFWKDGSMLNFVQHPPRMESVVQGIQRDPSRDLRTYLGLSNSINLDKAQGASLISGLTQTVSLIQGPPGTGKSFIGALLAKFIHDYSEQTILVVCYTNHALDQFLEDLLGIGIPADSLVRLGGKSSGLTEQLTLRNQARVSKLGKADWKIIEGCRAEAEIHVNSLKVAFQAYKDSSVSNAEIMDHIEFEDYEFYEAFGVPKSEDGMTGVGKRGRAVDEYYLLSQWSKDKDAGIFKQHPHVLRSPKIWGMSSVSRQAKIDGWKRSILTYQVTEVYESARQYNKCQAEVQRKFEEGDVEILRGKRIIGCTTTGAAKFKESIQAACPDVLLVEEAGEILESHVITALGADAKQMILIGDHKQLRPKVNHYALTVEKGDGYDLNRSLFERLVLHGYPHQTLVAQHRMRPEISSLIRHLTYPDLTDASRTSGRPDLRGVSDNIVFIDHTNPEDDNKQLEDRRDMGSKSSKQNTFEVEMVLKIVRYMIQQGYKTEELVVLTPYLGQLQKLREALKHETDPVLNDMDMSELFRAGVATSIQPKQNKKPLRLATIGDNYQGEESDVVIASLCRSNSENDIGFMFAPERLNVLLSRARNALVMIGNSNTFTNARKGKEIWRQLLQLLRNGKHVYDGFPVVCTRHPDQTALLKRPLDFNEKCPDGGCSNPCGKQLSCGLHTCPSKCHLSLVSHSTMLCPQIVEDLCPKGHKQSRKCHQLSGTCKKCEREAKLEEERLQKEFELEQKREAQKLEHERRLNDLQQKIAEQEQIVQDARLAQERAEALRQKQEDLKAAQNLAASAMSATSAFFAPITSLFSSPTSQPQPPPSQNTSGTSPSQNSNSPTQPGQNPTQTGQNPPPQRPPTPPGNLATTKQTTPEAEWNRQKDVEGANNAAIDAVMSMIGLEDVKRQMLRIKDKIEVTNRQGTSLKDERFNIVLLGNPGTGKTTVARQYAKFLTSQKILSGHAFLETTGARLSNEGVSGAEKLINSALGVGGGAIFIDEAYQLTSSHGHTRQGGQVLDFLLAEMENRVGTIVFILAGYSKQMEKFFEHNPGLPSRVPYTLKFTDYTDQELLMMLVHSIHKKYSGKMKVEDDLYGLYTRIAVKRLGRGRGREGFGNARALQNMFAKITERQAERITRQRREGQRPDDFFLQNEDIIGPDPSQAVKKSAAWTELQSLTGLKSVKESVRSLIDMISVNYRRELAEKEPMQMSLNRVFLGSPGTGKTTVGKLYGQILADIGMLSNGEVVVKNPADFVGSYIGHSEANTKAILASTVGKVLIIDEAYMLYGGRGGSHTDSFKTAVIDTIVAEVQSVPGEDRAILLLGYETQMREMFQNVNEGLSRRFAIEEAFKFEDFTNAELREIMDGKLKKQDLSATDAAKDVAMELLGRERNRPNFGNGGAVENLLGNTKSRYIARFRGSVPPADTVFEPQDFDPEFDRHLHASANLDKMFEDVVDCEIIIDKLREYQKISRIMKARGETTSELIPTSFVFKGPPGTGKTTIARKIGQVYYDMGFLASAKVEECSASDLVGQYVGHTGPKTKKLFEKALGQVLFIDEAYRLGDGRFAQEAVDELVGLLTHEKFKSKIVVILAGYDQDINKLLSVNSGLSSRFPEVIQFRNFSSKACLEILDKRLLKNKITFNVLRDPSSKTYSAMLSMIEDLSGIPSWGNARDVETLAKQMTGLVLKQLPEGGQSTELTLQAKDALAVMRLMLDEKRLRSNLPPVRHSSYEDVMESSSGPPPPPPPPTASKQASPPPPPPSAPPTSSSLPAPPPPSAPPASPPPAPAPLRQQQQRQQKQQQQQPIMPNQSQRQRKQRPSNATQPRPQQGPSGTPPPPRPNSSASTSTTTSQAPSVSNPQHQRTMSHPQNHQPFDRRDPGIPDIVWKQLLADEAAQARLAKIKEDEIRQTQARINQAIREEEKNRAAARALQQAEAAAKDAAERQEAKRRREEAERKQRQERAAREKLIREINRKKDEERKRKEAEAKVQNTLRTMGVCVQGYQWVKQPHGYRCRGGAHFIPNGQLGI